MNLLKMALKLLFFLSLILLFRNIAGSNVNAHRLFPAILVFGDSFVDSGNNNFYTPFISPNRADHHPYGKNFPNRKPTGRFSNGKLVPDFLAQTLGLKETVPPFLDPHLKKKDLVTGVSFASAGSGFDDLTRVLTGAISMSKQAKYLRQYAEKVKKIVGKKKGEKIINKALVVINAGTNDFTINYYDFPIRRIRYNITGYQDYVLKRLQRFIKEIHEVGCRTMIVTGLPPIGCLPIQMTVRFKNPKNRTCVDDQNADSRAYNQKLLKLIPQIQASLPHSRILFADIYKPVVELIQKSKAYGLKVTNRGCCGTGYFEVATLCNVLTPICKNVSEFMFWDSVHPTEAAYKYIYDSLLQEIGPQFSKPYTSSASI